jgi:hypothetical protein
MFGENEREEGRRVKKAENNCFRREDNTDKGPEGCALD